MVASAGLALVVWRGKIGVAGLASSSLTVALAATALGAGASTIPRCRAALLRPLGLDPASAVHAVAAVAFVLTLGLAAVDFVALRAEAETTIPLSPSDPLVALLGDTALAGAAVGWGQTRGLRATLDRLGVKPIGVGGALGALAVAALFHVLIGFLEHAEGVLLPDVAALEERFRYEFVGMPPVVGAVVLSLAVGAGEEILFRGALQPRVGVGLTALVFAATHVQYQLPGVVMIFAMGVVLGILRRRTSTTFVASVHALYDIGAFLLPGL